MPITVIRKMSSVIAACVMVAALLAGCNTNDNSAQSETNSKGTANTANQASNEAGQGENKDNNAGAEAVNHDKHMTIQLMAISYKGGGWPKKNTIIDQLDKKLNIDLQIQWVPGSEYDNKLNVLAASNSFPDAYVVKNQTQYKNWQAKGAFLDVKPELDQYPNLTKYLSEDEWQVLNPQGHYYGLPFYAESTRDSLAIRKDWLDNLNLSMPTTLDEFYQVAEAFAKNDPDGNGKADTIGFSFSLNPQKTVFNGLQFLQAAYGMANGWTEQEGKLVPDFVQAEAWKNVTSWLRKAYADDIVDKDFPVNKTRDPLNKFAVGKLGLSYVNPNELDKKTMPSLHKVDPKAVVVQLPPPAGPSGLRGTPTSLNTKKTVINSKIDKEKQQRILELFNYMLSDEGYNLIKNGIEGVHYKKTNNGYEKLPAFDKDRPYLLSTWLFRRDDPLVQVYNFQDQDYANKLGQWFANNKKYKWPNPAQGLVSETGLKSGQDLSQKFIGEMVKIIIGKDPVDNVDQAVADWKAGGGDQIMKEINAAYDK